MNNFLTHLTSLIIALFFAVFGILCLFLPWMPLIQKRLIQIVLESSFFVSLTGIGFILVGGAIAAYVLINLKRRTYHIRKGGRLIDVDQEVIDGYITHYLKEQFPSVDIPHQLVVRKKKIMIAADLPYIPESQQPDLTEKIYQNICDILREKIGCMTELYLSVSFQTSPSEER